jgi:uncharacterized caspase-like protein
VGQVKSITRPWHQERAIQSRPDGILKDLRRPGYVVMTASDDNESPVETPTLSNGVYTYYLVEGLQGPANNGGNFISSEAAHTYATPRSTAFYGGMHPQILDMHPGQYKLLIR